MALQDLTPQLRTRLSRMERAVGWFVILAIILLVCGFGYYVYNTAESKGWFRTKANFFCYTDSAGGLNLGDPVSLMGKDVGHITEIETMAPFSGHNIYVRFEIQQPYIGYIWTEGSYVEAAPANLLSGRKLQVTKGTSGYPAYTFHTLRMVSPEEAQHLPELTNWALAQEIYAPNSTNRLASPRDWVTNALSAIRAAGLTSVEVMSRDPNDKHKLMTGVWNEHTHRFDPYNPDTTKPFYLPARETPAVQDQVQALVAEVQHALPGIFNLTNELTAMLTNSSTLASNLNAVAVSARPAVSNLTAVTAQLNRPGALGEWLIPTNLNRGLEGTVSNANAALISANTNLNLLVQDLSRSLDNLANITSNLNQQVEVNSNIVSAVSSAIVHADEFVQGLKRHWLFRSAFKSKKTKEAPAPPSAPLVSPKEKGER